MTPNVNWDERLIRLRVPPAPRPPLAYHVGMCLFDFSHDFRVADKVVPTPSYHSPDCASAAMRREHRQRLVGKRGAW